jgi:hypothetical protein
VRAISSASCGAAGIRPGLQKLAILPGYGHQDPFMGKSADRDVFPRILAHLTEHGGRP